MMVIFDVVSTQVQIYDQIIFESVKSPGQYFHASAPYKIDNFSIGWLHDFRYADLRIEITIWSIPIIDRVVVYYGRLSILIPCFLHYNLAA